MPELTTEQQFEVVRFAEQVKLMDESKAKQNLIRLHEFIESRRKTPSFQGGDISRASRRRAVIKTTLLEL